MKYLVWLMAWWVSWVPKADAWTYRSPTARALLNVALAIKFLQDDRGETIRSWSDFDNALGPLKEVEYAHLRERYAFLDPPVQIPNGSKIILISRSSFRDLTMKQNWFGKRYTTLGKAGRLMLCEAPSGHIGLLVLDESRVVQLFEKAGVPLPAPDPLGLYPHEIKYRNRDRALLVMALIGCCIAVRYWSQKRKKRDLPCGGQIVAVPK